MKRKIVIEKGKYDRKKKQKMFTQTQSCLKYKTLAKQPQGSNFDTHTEKKKEGKTIDVFISRCPHFHQMKNQKKCSQ